MCAMSGLRLNLTELRLAIDEAALAKSKFFEELKKDIVQATAEKYEEEREVDGKKKLVEIENTVDNMITALHMIDTRSGKLREISDPFLRRIQRAARYIRILEAATFEKTKTITKQAEDGEKTTEEVTETALRFPRQVAMLRQFAREDIAICVKNITPDSTKFQSPLTVAGLKAGGATSEDDSTLASLPTM